VGVCRRGEAGDCVVRAIAIATGKPYAAIYESLHEVIRHCGKARRGKHSNSPRNGVERRAYQSYLEVCGWVWHPTMGIGTGCRVHLDADELPAGRIICRLSKHLVAVIDGVIHDTHDPQRWTTYGDGHSASRCVYGYFEEAR